MSNVPSQASAMIRLMGSQWDLPFSASVFRAIFRTHWLLPGIQLVDADYILENILRDSWMWCREWSQLQSD